jgi:hypothetical protein
MIHADVEVARHDAVRSTETPCSLIGVNGIVIRTGRRQISEPDILVKLPMPAVAHRASQK